jgi:AraC-like DNA-binding protein
VSFKVPLSDPSDSVELSRLVLAVAAAGGADARALAREAGLPDWLLGRDRAMVSSDRHARLWEIAEQALGDPALALTAINRHQVGDLDLYDYLFITAATVRDALLISGEFFPLISTNCSLEAGADTGTEITYSYRHVVQGGRGEELWTQFSIAGFCARIQAATGRPLVPARLAFAQRPPRSHQPFIETFGSNWIDFGAPVTTFTLHAADLDRPMPNADPVLAAILRRYAATLRPPEAVTWHRYFQDLLVETVGHGTVSLYVMASRLAVSPRTLQRRLADHGTNWRTELEIARQHRAQQTGGVCRQDLARELGYADTRSVRRAIRRWDQRADPDTGHR